MNLKIPYLTTTIEDDVITTLYLVPLWWLLGFNVIIYHAVTFLLFLKMLIISRSKPIGVPKVAAPLLFLIFIYGVSILVNYPQNEFKRTVLSFYSYSFWLMGFLLIVISYNFFNMNTVYRFVPPLRFNIAVIGILTVASVFLWILGYKNIEYPSPVNQLLGGLFPAVLDMSYLNSLTTVRFVSTDLVANIPLPRTRVAASFFNALAIFLVLSIPFALYSGKKGELAKQAFMVSLGIISILFTLSRTAVLSFVVAICVVLVMNRKHLLFIALLIIFSIAFSFPLFHSIFEWVNELRGGSSSLRFSLYSGSIDMVLRENPLIGFGVLPLADWTPLAVGSHSTYLSLFVRAGVVGVFFFTLFQFNILKIWFYGVRYSALPETRKIFNYIGISIIALSLFSLTEDIDASPPVTYLYFLLIGMMTVILKADSSMSAKEKA